MKKISALLLIVACVLIHPGASGAVDLEDGFMGIDWGVPAAEAGDLTKLYAKLEMFHDKARRFFPIEKDQQPEMIPFLKF